MPYVKDRVSPLRLADLSSVTEYKWFVKSVVEHECELTGDIVVAPYFHFLDLSSDWLKRNLKLLAETRLLLDRRKDTRPLWAVISTDIETLCDENAQFQLLNLYTRTEVDGYWFLVNFDEQTANLAQVFNYARTLLRFRETRRAVIAGRVGSFGLGLCAMGVTGFSSGMTSLENFSWTYFTDRSRMGGPKPRYYLERLLQNVPFEMAERIFNSGCGADYRCACCACNGSSRLQWGQARLHFLYAREQQLADLMAIPERARLSRFVEWVHHAQQDAALLADEGIQVRSEHFDIWLSALDELIRRGMVSAA